MFKNRKDSRKSESRSNTRSLIFTPGSSAHFKFLAGALAAGVVSTVIVPGQMAAAQTNTSTTPAAAVTAPATPPPYVAFAPNQTLTLDESLRLAVADNPLTKQDKLTVDIASKSITIAKANLKPIIYPDATATVSSNPNVGLVTGDTVVNSRSRERAELNASYTLYDGGVKKDAVNIAKQTYRQSLDGAAASRISILSQTTLAFYTTLMAQRLLDTDQLNSNAAQELLVASQAAYSVGRVTKGDVLTAQSAVASAVSKQDVDALALTVARSTLAEVIGADPSRAFPTVVDPGVDTELTDQSDVIMSAHITNDPSYDLLVSKYEASVVALDQSRASQKPQVTLGANTGVNNRDSGGDSASAFASASVTLTLAPLDRTIARATEQSLQDQISLARLNLQTYVSTAHQQIQDAYAEYQEASANVSLAQTAVASSDQARVLAEGQFEAGTGTEVAVINAISLVGQTRLLLDNTLSQRDRAIKSLRLFSGFDPVAPTPVAPVPIAAPMLKIRHR